MKREAVIALLSLSALVGCTKSEDLLFEDGTQPSDKISLSVENSSTPFIRGSVVDTQAKMASVGMYCAHTVAEDWNTSTTFNKMLNAKFAYDNETWVWNPAENDGNNQPTWGHTSLTEKYTFFAYSPHSSEVADNRLTTTKANGQPQITYIVTPTVVNQEDLMAAKPRKDIHPQSGGKVHMEFEHALAKVSFSVKGVNTRKIKSITIKDVHNQGTLIFSDTTPHFAWSEQSGTQSYTVSTAADGGNGAILDQTPDADESIETSLTTESGYLFMLPQSVSGKIIDLVVTNADGTDAVTESLTIPSGSEWTQSKYINYVITLTQNEVNLTVKVTSWNEESIDTNTKGTYLNILDNSIGSFDFKDVLIYYSTDHPDSQVSATYTKVGNANVNGSLTKYTSTDNYFLFPVSLGSGEYIITIKAGEHLMRKLKVTITINMDVVISLIAWDDTDIEDSTKGTYLNILDNSIGSFDFKDVLIYYSTDHPDSQVSATYTKVGNANVNGSLTKYTSTDNYFLFPVSLGSGEYIITIKAGEHLMRKLKVTITINMDVVISLIAWDDTDIEDSTKGTYLNILDNSIGSFDFKDVLIYYSTDHPDSQVSATYTKVGNANVNGSLTKYTSTDNYFLFPVSLGSGEYIITIKAGEHLMRKLKVTITISMDVVISLIAWDDTGIEDSTKGTHITFSHTQVDITANGTVHIYYSTDAQSVSASVDNDKIILSKSSGKITLLAAADILAPATDTLEIKADKITKKIKINIK